MSSAKKKVIISACLLGEYCRYDGKTKGLAGIKEQFQEYEIIPFCPEAPVFGTPRERIDVVETSEGTRVVTHNTKEDVTQKLSAEIEAFIAKNPKAEAIVLKSKSPSCGIGTTPIYDTQGNLLRYANGLAADIFLQRYEGVDIRDEHTL